MLPALPAILGNGVGGTVGEGARGPAQVVASLNGTGGYAERAVSPVARLIGIPDGLAMRNAVALLADGRTALALARHADLRAARPSWSRRRAAGWGRCWSRSPGGPGPGWWRWPASRASSPWPGTSVRT